jgi:hypothetical protein
VLPGTITSTAAPTVSGEARVDQVLTAGPGSWNPQPDGVQYQWRADGVPVAGATAPTLTVAPQHVGKALTVAVTAARSGYRSVTATSAATARVAPGVLNVTGTPTVSGALEPGGTLAVALPGALPRAAASEVQWLRAGVPVPGATGSTYQLTSADLGRRILAQVRLTRPGYTPVTTSTAWTGPVKATPRLRVATRTTGRRVTITVTASAVGAPPVAGLVLVRAHGRLLRTVSMRNGVATTTVTGLRPGRWAFRIGYPATRTLEAAVAVREVRIR